MGRAPLVGLLLVVWVGVADAGGTRKVDIDSDPQGATVYLNDIDQGAVCEATPCTIDAPIGKTPIIVRKDKYSPEIGELDIPRRGKIKPVKFSLTSAIGTLVIDDSAVKGASVKVDDVDKGAVSRVDVEADAHHVVVTYKGKTLFDDIVNVELGEEVNIKPKAPVVGKVDPVGGTGDGADGGGEGEDDGDKITKTAPATAHDVFIVAGGAFDVGFRQFRYDQPKNGLAATETEVGQAMLGPTAELWPAALLGASHLRGLSLFGKVEFGLNHQPVLDTMDKPTGATTFWQNLEIDARHRWHVGDGGMVEANGGFVRDQMQFNAPSAMVLAKVPVVDYKAIRLGLRAGFTAGKLEPYASVEGRIVLNGGELQTRFDQASVTGGRVAVGASTTIGPIFARLEGSLLYYAWTFKETSATAPSANGARDLVEVVSVIVGISH